MQPARVAAGTHLSVEPPSVEGRLVDELPPLRRFLRRLTGQGADADDLEQEVVARALRYRHAFDPGRALGPWLRRTAFRAFLDQRERDSRAPAALGDEHALVAPARDELEAPDYVRHLLDRLAPLERAALVRFHQRGESVREIAHALDLPEGTVKSHLHRARRRLAALDPEEGSR